jgi:hypothetical protein
VSLLTKNSRSQSTQLLHSSLTDGLSYVINTFYKCLICRQCKYAVAPKNARAHYGVCVSGERTLMPSHAKWEELATLVASHHIPPTLPLVPQEPLPLQVEGIQLHQGIGCSCGYVASNQKTMNNHKIQCEQGDKPTIPDVYFQKFSNSANAPSFRVRPLLVPTRTLDAWDVVNEEYKSKCEVQDPVAPASLDTREISRFLLVSGIADWQVLNAVKPNEMRHLGTLRDVAKSGPLAGLPVLVQQYFKHFHNGRHESNRYIRQCLRSREYVCVYCLDM